MARTVGSKNKEVQENPWDEITLVNGELQGMLTDELAKRVYLITDKRERPSKISSIRDLGKKHTGRPMSLSKLR